MELNQAIKERRSVREFTEKPISHQTIEDIIEVARFAPSWKNTQIVRYVVIDEKNMIEAIANEKCTYGFEFNIKTIKNAPTVVLLTYIEGRSGFEKDGSFSTPKGDRWQMFDAGIAAQSFCLAAYDKGIGSVILGYFDEEEIKKVIKIPEDQQIGAIIPIGYPNDTVITAPPRKDVNTIVTFV